MNERLLNSWVDAITGIRNNRFLSELSLNEMIVIRCLKESNDVTASLLCEKLDLLKSQMNHILQSMETKGLIIRERTDNDKRKVHLTLTEKGLEKYDEEHKRIGVIIERLEKKIGNKKAELLSELMDEAVKVIREENYD